MLRYRTFRNTDPPLLCDIWRSRAGCPGLLQPVSVELFEQLVFGKLHFDYAGLVLAFERDRPVGFAHASFEPDEQRGKGDRSDLPERPFGCFAQIGPVPFSSRGVVCVICVRPDCAEAEVAAGLLEQCEQYLRRRGARLALGGAVGPCCPFYLGLYGGCDPPGVLDADLVAAGAFLTRGFREVQQRLIFRHSLTDLRPPASRQQLQFRRQMTLQVIIDPPARSWWEACTTGDFDLTRFELLPRGDATPLAHAVVRNMGATLGSPWGRAAGVIEVEVVPEHRRQGLATFLLGEAFRTLASHGVDYVEAQIAEHDPAGVALYKKLGLQAVGRGTVYRKEL